jgi:predicted PurR-regulated permease PerM/cell division inhibitor SulA
MTHVRFSEYSGGRSILVVIGIVLLLLFAKVLFVPIAFALALCFLLLPGILRLEKRGIRRSIAVALVSIATFVAVGTTAFFLSRQVLHVAQILPSSEFIRAATKKVKSPALDTLEDTARKIVGYADDLTPHMGENVSPVRIVGEGPAKVRAAAELIGSILEPLGQVGIVLIFTIYMLINRDELRHRLLLLAGMGQINSMTKAMGDAADRISKYFVMQIQVNACYGTLFGVGIHLIGVPDATLWGVVAGVLRIIPFVGTLAAVAFPLILSFAGPKPLWHSISVVCLFLVLELVAANIVEPRVFSTRTGISELALLASAVFWSMLWGWQGLILATPLTVCVVVTGRYVPEFSFLHTLLGTNAQLSPAAHVYERLLALDQAQAWTIAEKYLDGKQLVELYDTIVIPVLRQAEEETYKGALTDVQSNFVRLSISELVARLAEYEAKVPSVEERTARSLIIEAKHAELQKEFAVICISTAAKGDKLATVMLVQLLERDRHQTIFLPPEALSDEILRTLATQTETVIFISALAPFAFAQTRALCQRVRTHMPDNRIAVALWNSAEDPDEMQARFGNSRPDAIVGTLADAIGQVKAWRLASRKP